MKSATSSRPCRERAARCSPAIQPSVRACRVDICSLESGSPITSLRKMVVSCEVKRKWSARSSLRSPSTQTCQWKRWVVSTSDDEVDVRRQIPYEVAEGIHDALSLDEVVVVQHQHRL